MNSSTVHNFVISIGNGTQEPQLLSINVIVSQDSGIRFDVGTLVAPSPTTSATASQQAIVAHHTPAPVPSVVTARATSLNPAQVAAASHNANSEASPPSYTPGPEGPPPAYTFTNAHVTPAAVSPASTVAVVHPPSLPPSATIPPFSPIPASAATVFNPPSQFPIPIVHVHPAVPPAVPSIHTATRIHRTSRPERRRRPRFIYAVPQPQAAPAPVEGPGLLSALLEFALEAVMPAKRRPDVDSFDTNEERRAKRRRL